MCELLGDSWRIGNMQILRHFVPDALTEHCLASWQDNRGRQFVLQQMQEDETQPPHTSMALEPFHSLDESAAVWCVAGIFCKVKKGHSCEDKAMELVKNRFPLVPIPDVIFSWTEGNTYFLITTSAIGDPLQTSWGLLTSEQRVAVAKEVAGYCQDLFSATSPNLRNVSGTGLSDAFLQLQIPSEQRTPQLGPLSLQQAMEHFSPLDFEGPFLLMHGDLTPANIIIQDGKVTGIIDWELAGYYPAFWVRFKARTHGMMLSSDKEMDEWEWTKLLDGELAKKGIALDQEKLDRWIQGKTEPTE
ncbi:hypothetical protein D6C78_11042 [Aureobasidium pullulans]|uniref:Aminoglycoside phosphotransferase domain-containing protein n=1 Tax=Aureobasidium pullulans TaxID=5580 RepID=A0A4V4LCL5_AURPU|nr:hypothetical protein D6C78_11042 [Aureobasidium pullulans]